MTEYPTHNPDTLARELLDLDDHDLGALCADGGLDPAHLRPRALANMVEILVATGPWWHGRTAGHLAQRVRSDASHASDGLGSLGRAVRPLLEVALARHHDARGVVGLLARIARWGEEHARTTAAVREAARLLSARLDKGVDGTPEGVLAGIVALLTGPQHVGCREREEAERAAWVAACPEGVDTPEGLRSHFSTALEGVRLLAAESAERSAHLDAWRTFVDSWCGTDLEDDAARREAVRQRLHALAEVRAVPGGFSELAPWGCPPLELPGRLTKHWNALAAERRDALDALREAREEIARLKDPAGGPPRATETALLNVAECLGVLGGREAPEHREALGRAALAEVAHLQRVATEALTYFPGRGQWRALAHAAGRQDLAEIAQRPEAVEARDPAPGMARHAVVAAIEAMAAQTQAVRDLTGRVDPVEGCKLLADEVWARGCSLVQWREFAQEWNEDEPEADVELRAALRERLEALKAWREWAIGTAGNGWARRAAGVLGWTPAPREGDERARELIATAVESAEGRERGALLDLARAVGVEVERVQSAEGGEWRRWALELVSDREDVTNETLRGQIGSSTTAMKRIAASAVALAGGSREACRPGAPGWERAAEAAIDVALRERRDAGIRAAANVTAVAQLRAARDAAGCPPGTALSEWVVGLASEAKRATERAEGLESRVGDLAAELDAWGSWARGHAAADRATIDAMLGNLDTWRQWARGQGTYKSDNFRLQGGLVGANEIEAAREVGKTLRSSSPTHLAAKVRGILEAAGLTVPCDYSQGAAHVALLRGRAERETNARARLESAARAMRETAKLLETGKSTEAT